MSFQFEGREFATMADFARAYPVYRNHAPAVRDGVGTIVDLERHIAQQMAKARQAGIKSARRNAKLNLPNLYARRAGRGGAR